MAGCAATQSAAPMHLGARVRRLASRMAVAAAAGCTVALACSAPSALADSGKRVRFRKSDTETIEAAGGEGGIEILVHNLSHADMAVLLTARESADGSQPMTRSRGGPERLSDGRYVRRGPNGSQ